MNKKLVETFVYGILIGAWLAFCICKLAGLQEKQREATLPTVNRTEVYIEFEPTTLEQTTEAIIEETTTADIIVEETTETEVAPNYTEEDLMLLAQLIEAEGGIESYQCKLYIGSVVLNRVQHSSFPNTLRDVIFQVDKDGIHQFSVTYVREDGTRAIDCIPREESFKAAEYLITYGTQLPPDILVFYASYCTEGWVTTRAEYTKVDTTVFAYLHSK